MVYHKCGEAQLFCALFAKFGMSDCALFFAALHYRNDMFPSLRAMRDTQVMPNLKPFGKAEH